MYTETELLQGVGGGGGVSEVGSCPSFAPEALLVSLASLAPRQSV